MFSFFLCYTGDCDEADCIRFYGKYLGISVIERRGGEDILGMTLEMCREGAVVDANGHSPVCPLIRPLSGGNSLLIALLFDEHIRSLPLVMVR